MTISQCRQQPQEAYMSTGCRRAATDVSCGLAVCLPASDLRSWSCVAHTSIFRKIVRWNIPEAFLRILSCLSLRKFTEIDGNLSKGTEIDGNRIDGNRQKLSDWRKVNVNLRKLTVILPKKASGIIYLKIAIPLGFAVCKNCRQTCCRSAIWDREDNACQASAFANSLLKMLRIRLQNHRHGLVTSATKNLLAQMLYCLTLSHMWNNPHMISFISGTDCPPPALYGTAPVGAAKQASSSSSSSSSSWQ